VDRQTVAASVDSMRRVLRALRIAARDTLATAGVSAAQLFVLGALVDTEEASLSELAKRTMTDRTSVTAVVDRLVRGGLVTKRTSSEDRRRASIRITPKGRTVLRGAPRPPTALLVEALERLEPADLACLERGLRALTRAMGIDGGPTDMLFEDGPADEARVQPSRSRPR
jgi:DNA-binding MarR family transcriptional regulator